MLVVPLKGDRIVTKDGASLLVEGYTNFKNRGPAVYCSSTNAEFNSGDGQFIAIYFFDIDKINDVRVEFNSSSKVLNALGRLKRKIHLPQQHDLIEVFKPSNNEDGSKSQFDKSAKVKVSGLKLHSKKYGIAKGLLIEDEDKNVYLLDEILDIEREIGNSLFNKKLFLKIYGEYVGHKA